MDTKLAPYIKPNGIIALAFPGFKKDYHNNLPSELLISWGAEDLDTFHSCKWWHELHSQSPNDQYRKHLRAEVYGGSLAGLAGM